VKMTFKLKINIKRNPLNFKSIQWNHLQAFTIWWDYPFKNNPCSLIKKEKRTLFRFYLYVALMLYSTIGATRLLVNTC
jgi:hypothetical protein